MNQYALMAAAFAVLAAFLYVFSGVLTPFITAALLAYLFDPGVVYLQRLRLPRTPAIVIVFTLGFTVLIGSLVLLVPMLEPQLRTLIGNLPQGLEWLQGTARPWLEQLGLELPTFDAESLKAILRTHGREAGGYVAGALSQASRSGAALVQFAVTLAVIPVITFFLLRDWHTLIARLQQLIPPRYLGTLTELAQRADARVGAFLRGQLTVMLAMAVIYTLGLKLAGLELALAVGLVAGLVSFVPYLGFIVGIALASIAMLVQTHSVGDLLPVLGVFTIGQLLEGMLLTPLLVGDRIALHPVMVIFAVLAGGELFGFIGILLALPVTAVLAVVIEYAYARYRASAWYAR